MTENIWHAIFFFLILTWIPLALHFALGRIFDSPGKQIARAHRKARALCASGRHDWDTPWRPVSGIADVYQPGIALPVRRERHYMTTCRQCGEPTTKCLEVG